MRHISRHLTYANVMVTLLAFIVLGGGTALAAYVVSSNSQIGPGTVSGHKPPSGKHANVIAGSINGQDVLENSLGGRVIAEPTLSGNARKLIWHGSSFVENEKIATIYPYTFKGSCSMSPHVTGMVLSVNGPAGTAAFMTVTTDDPGGPSGANTYTQPIPANQDTGILFPQGEDEAGTGPQRIAGTVMLSFGPSRSQLMQIDFNASAGFGSCDVVGTVTRAT
jgi:hypothetical protein